MKCSLGISNFLEEISRLSQSVVFLYFFALITEEGFFISPCYCLELCIQMFISFLFSFAFPFSSFHSYYRSWLWLRSWTPYCQIQIKLKKVGKTTRPFRYDLNQIPYDYTVEVRNRFKGLDLIDRVPEKLWTELHDIVQETGIKPSPWKRNAKKQNGCLGRTYK